MAMFKEHPTKDVQKDFLFCEVKYMYTENDNWNMEQINEYMKLSSEELNKLIKEKELNQLLLEK